MEISLPYTLESLWNRNFVVLNADITDFCDVSISSSPLPSLSRWDRLSNCPNLHSKLVVCLDLKPCFLDFYSNVLFCTTVALGRVCRMAGGLTSLNQKLPSSSEIPLLIMFNVWCLINNPWLDRSDVASKNLQLSWENRILVLYFLSCFFSSFLSFFLNVFVFKCMYFSNYKSNNFNYRIK